MYVSAVFVRYNVAHAVYDSSKITKADTFQNAATLTTPFMMSFLTLCTRIYITTTAGTLTDLGTVSSTASSPECVNSAVFSSHFHALL